MAKRIPLPPRMDTAATEALRSDLLAAEGEDIVLDGSAVDQFGALCLELILSVSALWRAEGHGVTIENPSNQMAEDLGRFGLTPEMLTEVAA